MPAWAWRFIAYGLLILALIGFGWVKGNEHGTKKLTDYQAAQAIKTADIIVKQGKITEVVVTKFIERQGKSREVINTISKDIIKYVETSPRLVLDADWVGLHNRAALISEAPGDTDGATGEVTTAQAIQTITDNYFACTRNSMKLEALQEWIREQAKVK